MCFYELKCFLLQLHTPESCLKLAFETKVEVFRWKRSVDEQPSIVCCHHPAVLNCPRKHTEDANLLQGAVPHLWGDFKLRMGLPRAALGVASGFLLPWNISTFNSQEGKRRNSQINRIQVRTEALKREVFISSLNVFIMLVYREFTSYCLLESSFWCIKSKS